MATYFTLVMFALLCLPLSLIPIANSISFKFSRFDPNSTRIHYQGDAVYSVGKVEFNMVNYITRVGQITYGEQVRLWDKKTKKKSDFLTNFTFVIDILHKPLGKYGHGLTFFIAPAGFQIPPNSAGGFLGLFNTTTSHSSSNKMIVVEFDSFSNPEWDPSYEHVGININSIESSVTKRWNATQHSGVPADVSIIYNASTENLSVYWSYSNEPKNFLSYPIDLMQVIPEWVSIGFSAATGQFAERHILESWEFYSSLNITEDEALRKDNNDDLQIKVEFNKLGLILVSLGVFLFILGGIIVLFFLCRKRKMPRQERAEDTSFNEEIERGAGPRRFSYIELESATQNFSSERKLGEGGFGGVYKGYLTDLDMPIAVKKFSRGGRQGKKEYSTEVKIISRLRHRNLVQLIGWCHDKGEFLLVYEYMPNGSLVTSLFSLGNKPPLSWPARYNIALGLASGLFYLHEEWEQCVIHRDIKSSNIMLDSNYNVKLGDFGLATLMQHGHSAQTITLAGTFGYMAPEYLSTGKASKESDVYSFGVVVLQIATGRRSTDLIEAGTHQGKGLVQWVWDLYGNGELHLAIDQKLYHMECDAKQIECLMLLGLWCAYPDYNHRPSIKQAIQVLNFGPSIKQAIQVLNFETIMPSLPPKMPVPIYQVPMMPSDSSSSGPSMLNTSVETGR